MTAAAAPPLHTFSDGSTLRVISSYELIRIPIWKGNRVIDTQHVETIKRAIGDKIRTLDSGYRIVIYKTVDAAGRPTKESAIVDGQHRARVLRDFYESSLCEPPFPVVVTEKEVGSEIEVIAHFNAINNTKPIQYTDTNLIINRYIEELETAFNTRRGAANKLIRPKATTRPFLCVERIREVFQAHSMQLRDSVEDVQRFVAAVKEWNAKKVASAEIDMLSAKRAQADYIQRAAGVGFMLALDPALPWIGELL
jgi:hypothetical protein